ncbi:MAG: hypothetical protein J6L86_06645 [Alphaproteobacteria bacterium]|nr:hypothetical protein [Alphaproteobacteria bacterium]
MSKSRYYFWILAAALIVLGIGFTMRIPEITNPAYATAAHATNPWILVVAAISAFLLGNFRHYWIAVIVTGLITAVCIHLFVLNGSFGTLDTYTTLYRTLAFTCIVYLLNLVRLIFSRF